MTCCHVIAGSVEVTPSPPPQKNRQDKQDKGTEVLKKIIYRENTVLTRISEGRDWLQRG